MKLEELDHAGMSGARLFAYSLLMAAAGAAFLGGLFVVLMRVGLRRAPEVTELVALVVGAVGVWWVGKLKGGGKRFRTVLTRHAARVGTLRITSVRADGAGLGLGAAYAWLVDRDGRNLAALVLNDPARLGDLRALVEAHVPGVVVEETREVAKI